MKTKSEMGDSLVELPAEEVVLPCGSDFGCCPDNATGATSESKEECPGFIG